MSPSATPSPPPAPSAVASPVVAVTGHAGSPSALRSPSQSQSQSQSPSASAVGVVQVSQGTWVDWDTGTPTLQGTTGEPPTPVDLRIGPDNAYPENSARLWRTDSPGSCATQAASNGGAGFQTELDLHAALQPQAGSTVSACLVTTGRRVAVLTISSAGDNTFAPYKIQYRLS